MAHISEQFGDSISVTSNNKVFKFLFLNEDETDVELVFVRTKGRLEDDITSQYSELDDIPTEVIQCLNDEGITVRKVRN